MAVRTVSAGTSSVSAEISASPPSRQIATFHIYVASDDIGSHFVGTTQINKYTPLRGKNSTQNRQERVWCVGVSWRDETVEVFVGTHDRHTHTRVIFDEELTARFIPINLVIFYEWTGGRFDVISCQWRHLAWPRLMWITKLFCPLAVTGASSRASNCKIALTNDFVACCIRKWIKQLCSCRGSFLEEKGLSIIEASFVKVFTFWSTSKLKVITLTHRIDCKQYSLMSDFVASYNFY